MKTLLLLGIVVSSLLLTGCATKTQSPKLTYHPIARSSPAAELWVISATYGSGTQFVDVTYRVNDLMHQPQVEFFARPEWLKADPTPGWNKALVIVYEFQGRRQIFATGEGGRVSLETLVESAR